MRWSPSFLRFPESRAGRAFIDTILRYFDAKMIGAENIPREGGTLAVVNHGLFGFDAFVLGALVWRHTQRLAVWLADGELWKTPGLGATLDWVGAIPGTPEVAVRELRAGHLVVVYPGGIFDSYKLWHDRHKLKWRGRAGFARVAIRAHAPIVPIAACGVDDMYRIVGREPGVGKLLFGDQRYNFPIALGRLGTPIPRRARVTLHAMTPVIPNAESNEAEVERIRALVHDSIQAKLDET